MISSDSICNIKKTLPNRTHIAITEECIKTALREGAASVTRYPACRIQARAIVRNPQHRPLAPLPPFQAGQWYCLEQLVDMGTPSSTGTSANGRLVVWLNAQSVGDYQDL
jgi:hypothetical protein